MFEDESSTSAYSVSGNESTALLQGPAEAIEYLRAQKEKHEI